MDLNYTRDTTSGDEGLDAVTRIRSFDAHTPIVLMTAWGTIDLAVEGMRRGAQDFIEKPWDNERLLDGAAHASRARPRAAARAHARGRESPAQGRRGEALIAESAAMQPVLETIERVAPTDANVLITGESGCGKGLVARLIHEGSPRRERSLVTVNIGSLAETVFESEMFGHVKGAFTDAKNDRVGRFELADGGTLFLDEIANIPVAQQGRLLRVLEDGQFERLGSSRTQRADVRVLAATNADIDGEIAAGRFRADLLYRLNTIHIHLPPLRERGDDIVRLAQRFLEPARAASPPRRARRSREPALSALRRYALARQRARAQSRRRARRADGARRGRSSPRICGSTAGAAVGRRSQADDARRGRARCDSRGARAPRRQRRRGGRRARHEPLGAVSAHGKVRLVTRRKRLRFQNRVLVLMLLDRGARLGRDGRAAVRCRSATPSRCAGRSSAF